MPCETADDADFHEKSFRIKHEDDKFFTRLLSKESSKSNPSFRVLYYGDVSSNVPFTWETRPGTPKYSFSQNSYNIPPLTPPPSYYNSSINDLNNSSKKNYSRSKLLLHTLLRRMNLKKQHLPSSPSSTSSLSSLSWSSGSQHSNSSFSDPISCKPTYAHRRSRSCFVDDRECMDDGLCLGKENRQRLQSGLILKKAFLSIVGRGSS